MILLDHKGDLSDTDRLSKEVCFEKQKSLKERLFAFLHLFDVSKKGVLRIFGSFLQNFTVKLGHQICAQTFQLVKIWYHYSLNSYLHTLS